MLRWWWLPMLALAGCSGINSSEPARGPLDNRPPSVEVDAPVEYVGYGSEVRIDARIFDPDQDSVDLQWTQVAGPTVSLEQVDTATLAFRTHERDELHPPVDGPIRFLTVSRYQAGHYRFRLTADDGTARAEAEVLVRAAPTHPGWPRAEQGVETVVEAGLEQDRYDWEVSFSPPRSEPVLAGEKTRRPTIKLARPGAYKVLEKVSGRELSFHGGPWMGTEQCGRVECHPIEARGWTTTKMGTVLQRGLDGQLRADYGPECLRCHTVGWNETVDNAGFDDMARREGWSFPRRLGPGNFDALPFALTDRANVGCEACHGAGRFYTSYATSVCAECHDEPPDYIHPTEWRRAPMAQIRDGILGRAECERCHTAQGFLDEYYGHRPARATAREEDVQYTPEPITCPTCHDPHDGETPRNVRLSGPLFGQEPDIDWGAGMICLACHHGGMQWRSKSGALMRPFVPRFRDTPEARKISIWDRRLAPHAPQGDVVRGRAGYAMPGPGPLEASPPHLTVPGGCLGCHVRTRPPEGDEGRLKVGGHTFAMFHGEGERRVENTLACVECHGELPSLSREVGADYDGDRRREGIFEEVEGLLGYARQALDTAIVRANIRDGRRTAASFAEHDGYIVLVDADGEFLREGNGMMTFSLDHERLYRSTYNYLVVVKDRSRGVHNPVLTVRLLQRIVLRHNPRQVPRWEWR